jgi:hypothetical protein
MGSRLLRSTTASITSAGVLAATRSATETMAAVYKDNFGYYDLESDPDEAAFFAFVKKPEQAATMLALPRARPVAARSRNVRAML